MVQASDFNNLLKKHENIIFHLIHKYGIRDPENEFYQEGIITLWKAFETYDETKGKFSTYAYFLIQKKFLTLIRKHNRQWEKNQ
ncbi:DNA-directed RNA polymerase [Salinibacillus kushneri]|uniref:DNA-directed RNA polymerase n=1 Tax=Salinibacillus kushneri TaxID=237682 RepID=A0A1I0EXE7_9BACI|nr:sigma factor [Salinibacillus kushneri]SET50339.1 DNA-directed RNA polymerase [Salinibacillus kushneri]